MPLGNQITTDAKRISGSISSGITLLEDEPDITRGAVNPTRLFKLLAAFLGISVLIFTLLPGLGTLAMCVAGTVGSIQLSKLQGKQELLQKVLIEQSSQLASLMGTVFVFQLLHSAFDGVFLLGSFAGFMFLIMALYSIYAAWAIVGDPMQTSILPHQPQLVQRAIVPIEILRRKRAEMDVALENLTTCEVYDFDDEALEKAWSDRNLDMLDEIFRSADKKTNAAWQEGIAQFNSMIGLVDLARGRLRQLVQESEAMLTSFDVDLATLDLSRSKTLEGYSFTAERQKYITENAYYEHSYGMAVSRVTTGQLPWQVAAIFIVGTTIWRFVNQSKALRQLKEIEGKLKANAAAAKSDFDQFRALLTTRIIPQYDALVEVIGHLETGLSELSSMPPNENQDPATKESAFRLASAVGEGRRLLQMAGGN